MPNPSERGTMEAASACRAPGPNRGDDRSLFAAHPAQGRGRVRCLDFAAHPTDAHQPCVLINPQDLADLGRAVAKDAKEGPDALQPKPQD